MDFTPASQNGIVPPSETLTQQSRLGLAVSSTSTVYGNELILKAISDASMYKTEPVTFYRVSDGNTVSLGTGTWINTNTSVLVTTGIGTGTHQLHVTWPGEGMFSPQSTINTPVDFTVAAGYQLGATISHTANPPTNTVVTGEGAVTFTVTVSTATVLVDTLSFYIGNTFYGQANFSNNVATFTFPELPAGDLTIRTNWPGATIDGKNYEGFTYDISYTVLASTNVGQSLSITADPTEIVYGEGQSILYSYINTSTSINVGTISYYDNSNVQVLLGVDDSVVGNASSIFITTVLSTGTHYINAIYDGNPTGHPRYTPITSTGIELVVLARDTATLVLTDSPDPTLVNRDSITLTATLQTPKVASGNVTFYDGDNVLGIADMVDRVAVFTATNLSVGVHNLKAFYSGSAVAPKFFATTSSVITATVISALPYPGTMTLTGPTNFNRFNGPQTYTVTGSVNTVTAGLIILNAIIPASEVKTTTTSILSVTTASIIVGSNGISNTSTTILSTTTSTVSVLNPLTGQEQNVISTNTTARTTATAYTNYVSSPSTTNGYGITQIPGEYRINVFASRSILAGTFKINGSGNYTVTRVEGEGPPGNYFQMYYTPGYTGSFPVTLTFNSQSVTETKTTSVSTTTSRSGFAAIPVSTATFTGSNVQSIIFDPSSIPSSSTVLQAYWQGQDIVSPSYTPYVGTLSNVLTATIVPSNLVLSLSTLTNSILLENTFTVSANTSNIITNIVKLYSSSTVIATSTIPSGTSTVSITVASGVIPLGTGTVRAVLTGTNIEVNSNELSLSIVPRVVSTTTVSLSTTSSTSPDVPVNATITLTQPYNFRKATGTYSVFANDILITTATLSTSTSTVVVPFTPSTYATGTNISPIVVVKASYSGDGFLQESTGTTNFEILRVSPVITTSGRNFINSGAFFGSYFNSVDLIATFPNNSNSSYLPTSVNWLNNGGYIASTPVINGAAYLNNLVLPFGTNYMSVSFGETVQYVGPSSSLGVNVVPSGGVMTISASKAASPVKNFNYTVNWSYTRPEGTTVEDVNPSANLTVTYWYKNPNAQPGTNLSGEYPYSNTPRSINPRDGSGTIVFTGGEPINPLFGYRLFKVTFSITTVKTTNIDSVTSNIATINY
jgi:hypothetical protein